MNLQAIEQQIQVKHIAAQLDDCDVWVLGGGISGITTALALQLIGARAGVISDYVPMQDTVRGKSGLVASDYAMASAYPHFLKVQKLEQITRASQNVFAALHANERSGIKIHRIFEVYEDAQVMPDLAKTRMNVQEFQGTGASVAQKFGAPVRNGAEMLWGWRFESYFADMPRYVPFLWSLFRELGGKLVVADLTPHVVELLVARRTLVNCLGFGSVSVFDDATPALIMRGRQLIVPGAPEIVADDGMPIAYNYTPCADVFSRADGTPEYVHFFSRSDGWVLGQTREPGRFVDGGWVGEQVLGEHLQVEDELVPAAILNLNENLLRSWNITDFRRYKFIPRTGYRYYRDPNATGVRLECDASGPNPEIHNYGHGGSGITVSWGCAAMCASYLQGAGFQPRGQVETGFKNALLAAIELMG